jgi:hypothetical protein
MNDGLNYGGNFTIGNAPVLHYLMVDAMKLPHVSSEGGPIILGDFQALRAWRRTFFHYNSARRLVRPANPRPVALGGAISLVWDFGGPGTGYIVVVSDTHVSVVCLWPNASLTESETETAVVFSAGACLGTEVLAHLTISSGYLLALWAAEDASEFSPPRGAKGIPEPGLKSRDGGAYVSIPCGRYEITASEWQTDKFDVTKLDLFRMGPGTETGGQARE